MMHCSSALSAKSAIVARASWRQPARKATGRNRARASSARATNQRRHKRSVSGSTIRAARQERPLSVRGV
eukprot:scaffold91766_cov69-Phaeocystis_antarctica.AAC.1